jgi:hypothetical protein
MFASGNEAIVRFEQLGDTIKSLNETISTYSTVSLHLFFLKNKLKLFLENSFLRFSS